ncbi:MAG: glycosyltransferase family 1 protein, partial [Betaproteobacteria bacterium]
QSLNALVQMHRLSNNRFLFEVFTTHPNNLVLLSRLGIEATAVRISVFDSFLHRLSNNSLWQSLQTRLKLVGSLEKRLLLHGCDLVYFVTPSNLPFALQTLNYVTTLWDLCHRESPEFPEVRRFNMFSMRDNGNRNRLGPALLTLTESQRLADIASRCYGVEHERFLAMPLSPSPFLQPMHAVKAEDVLIKYSLDAGYYFYPAQFWAHKNHIRILQALVILRDKFSRKPYVVFSGKDYGNLGHIQGFISSNMLDSQVKILGFVPFEDMRGLFENATAVVMPTYFGPTNMPPLEAWSLGIPLIYSSHLVEQAGNAALLVDPDSAEELATAMRQCSDAKVRDKLIEAGHQRLAEISRQRTSAEEKLCIELDKYSIRRMCWP